MRWIGHTEFGPNYIPFHTENLSFEDDLTIDHWIEQWYYIYRYLFDSFKANENVYFICYEKLCNTDDYWFDLLKILKIKKTYNFGFKESNKVISLELNPDTTHRCLSLYEELSRYVRDDNSVHQRSMENEGRIMS